MDNSFPKSLRLRRSYDYRTLKKRNSFFKGRFLIFEYIIRDDLRLGITVSKSFGCAVKRGALKRRIREVFRTLSGLNHLWINVKPKLGTKPTYWEVKEDFEDFIHAYYHLPSS